LHLLGAAVDVARHGDDAVFEAVDVVHVGDLVQVELLRHLRAHLCGVAVDGLASANHEVGHANLFDGRGERIRRGERVGSGEGAVGQQKAAVQTAIETFADEFGGTRRSHREQMDRGSGKLLLQAQGLFKGVQVFGIEDGGQGGAIHGSLRRHGVGAHVARVGHLLGEYDDFQTHCICFMMI